MLKASPNNSDDEDATPKVGNLFASFKAKTPTSADASTPSKISVASEIRQVLPLLLRVVLLHNYLLIVYNLKPAFKNVQDSMIYVLWSQ